MICSLNEYAPDLGDFVILITLENSFPDPVCNDATTFLAIINLFYYLISL